MTVCRGGSVKFVLAFGAMRHFAFSVLALLSVSAVAQAAPTTVSLGEALALARRDAPAATDARQQRDVQAAQLPAAALAPLQNPSVEFGVERGAYYRDVVAYGQLLLRFEVGGQRAARIAEADASLRGKDARLAVTVAEVSGATAEAFGGVLAARARLTEVDRGLGAAEEEERIYRARAHAGDATLVDVAASEAEVGRWRQLRRTSEMALVASAARFAQFVGSQDLRPEGDVLPPRVDAPNALPAFPVVRALESESDAATQASARAQAEAWGTLDLGPRLTRGDFGELRTGLVFGGSLPLVRRNQGEVARLDAEAVRARKLAAVATTTCSIRVHAAFERATLARATLAELDANAIPAAERTVTSAQEAFRAGKGDFYRILLARRDLVAARMRRLDVVELAWGAYAELVALGAIEP